MLQLIHGFAPARTSVGLPICTLPAHQRHVRFQQGQGLVIATTLVFRWMLGGNGGIWLGRQQVARVRVLLTVLDVASPSLRVSSIRRHIVQGLVGLKPLMQRLQVGIKGRVGAIGKAGGCCSAAMYSYGILKRPSEPARAPRNPTSLNIASSWSKFWGVLSNAMSRFTTGMVSATTTGLRILNCGLDSNRQVHERTSGSIVRPALVTAISGVFTLA
ncbi:hypothetical protein LCGC14_0944940 [marine sediment metagenome]|uniref:Uncharacterized protein n=1 Tax=marine sediment metagenome TaxID=412755 RepID=A0A0F9P519_9ZZZZ